MNDLGSISQELQNEPEDLRQSILSGVAKLKGLDLLIGANAFQRDGARLDARQRAVYRKHGLDVKEDDDTISNILADNITINEPPVSVPTPPPVQPTPPKPAGRLLPWLLAAGLVGAHIAGTAYLIKNLQQGIDTTERTTIGLSTE